MLIPEGQKAASGSLKQRRLRLYQDEADRLQAFRLRLFETAATAAVCHSSGVLGVKPPQAL